MADRCHEIQVLHWNLNPQNLSKYVLDLYDRRIVSYVIGNFNNNSQVFSTFYAAIGCEFGSSLHIAKLNGRVCGAKRPHSVSEQPIYTMSR